jgi:hypothetical protein
MVPVADAIERSDANIIKGNRLAVDDAGARAQAGYVSTSSEKR